MGATLLGTRLHDVRVLGQSFTATMKDSCISASLSLSKNQVTEMSLTFSDNMTADLWRHGIFTPGTNIDYGGFQLVIDDVDFGVGTLGPAITVKAPSRFVSRFKKKYGPIAWGVRDVSEWMSHIADEFGMKSVVQPGLGTQDILLEGRMDGQSGPPPNLWDLMAQVARDAGAWLYEVRDTLYVLTPEWKRNNATRKLSIYYNSWFDYSEILSGPPSYHGSGTGEAETLSFGLISNDADDVVTGDIVSLTGSACGDMEGTWIIESVAYPMSVAGAVTVSCRRVGAPPPGISALNSDASAILGIGEVNWAVGNFTTPNFNTNFQWPVFYTSGSAYNMIMSAFQKTEAAASGAVGVASVDAFVRKYSGRAIDFDGAFGAQCVDLTAFYFKEVVGVTPARGNGKDIFYNQSAGVTKHPGAGLAKPGDVVCWGSALGGGYGHVAVALADQGGSILCFSQNPGPCRQIVISKSGMIGYLRPTRSL